MNGNNAQGGWGFTREDVAPGLITAGLSILANNNGRMNVPQLIGQGGLDAMAGLAARKKYEMAMQRQQMEDERVQQAHDLQMQRGQMELAEANRKAELVKRWQAGDQSAYKLLYPEQWAMDQRQAQDHRNALELAKAKETSGKYVDGVGMVSPSGVVTPLTDASGQPYMTPKQRKEDMDAAKQAKALENQKAFALQTAKTQLTSLDNALKLTKGYDGLRNTGLVGSVRGWLPGTDARNLRAELDTIGSGAMIQTMMQLKAASPTGATGMGALNKEEGQALRDSLGSLDTWQSPEQLRRTLENIKTVYTNMLLSWGYSPEDVAGMFGDSGDNKGDISRFDK